MLSQCWSGGGITRMHTIAAILSCDVKGNKLELCKSIYITPKQAGHWQKSLCNIITYLWFIKCFFKIRLFLNASQWRNILHCGSQTFWSFWFSLYIYCMLILEIFSTLRYNPPQNENSVIIYSPAVSSKPVRISFFCRNQKKIFYWNSIGSHWLPLYFFIHTMDVSGKCLITRTLENILKERHIV